MRLFLTTIGIATVITVSCKKEEPVTKKTDSQLEFADIYNKSVTFVTEPSSKVTDTVFLQVIVKGSAPTKKSYITLTQFDTTGTSPRAVAGVHYVAFNDPSLKEKLVLEAGQLETTIPIVILRDESLKTEVHQLDFRISSNEYFIRGVDTYNKAHIKISDQLVQPSNWIYFPPRILFFLGSYGPVKHRFIIDESGEPWDYNFIQYYVSQDAGAQAYYKAKFVAALTRVNNERATAGLPPLREDPNDPNTAVTF